MKAKANEDLEADVQKKLAEIRSKDMKHLSPEEYKFFLENR